MPLFWTVYWAVHSVEITSKDLESDLNLNPFNGNSKMSVRFFISLAWKHLHHRFSSHVPLLPFLLVVYLSPPLTSISSLSHLLFTCLPPSFSSILHHLSLSISFPSLLLSPSCFSSRFQSLLVTPSATLSHFLSLVLSTSCWESV